MNSAFSAVRETQCPGLNQLIEEIDSAVVGSTSSQVVAAGIRSSLRRSIVSGDLRLSRSLRRGSANGYARRRLYQSDRFGYSVLAMIWGPGQGTPIHDHSGMWCVEAVLEGQLVVTQYELVDRAGALYSFKPVTVTKADPGQAGLLIPPVDYHTIRNEGEESAVTIHVYAGEMLSCNIFVPRSEPWYQKETRLLSYDM